MDPTESEKTARQAVARAVTRIHSALAQDCSIMPIGSQTTGLAMPTSDLDFRLHHMNDDILRNETESAVQREHLIEGLKRLQASIEAHPDFVLTDLYVGRFPTLISRHKHTGLRVQIVASPDVSKARTHIQHELAHHPNLKAIFIVMRTILDMRKLSDVYNGGLSSYSIFMLVKAALEAQAWERMPTLKQAVADRRHGITGSMRKDANNKGDVYISDSFRPEPIAAQTASQQLLYVLNFWSRRFNSYRFGINASNGVIFRKKTRQTTDLIRMAKADPFIQAQLRMAEPQRSQPYLLCLQDPCNPDNDLGGQAFSFKHIQATMLEILCRVEDEFKKLESNQDAMREKRLKYPFLTRAPRDGVCILRHLIGRCDTTYDETRARLELFGEGYLQDQGDGSANSSSSADIDADSSTDTNHSHSSHESPSGNQTMSETEQAAAIRAFVDGRDVDDEIEEHLHHPESEASYRETG